MESSLFAAIPPDSLRPLTVALRCARVPLAAGSASRHHSTTHGPGPSDRQATALGRSRSNQAGTGVELAERCCSRWRRAAWANSTSGGVRARRCFLTLIPRSSRSEALLATADQVKRFVARDARKPTLEREAPRSSLACSAVLSSAARCESAVQPIRTPCRIIAGRADSRPRRSSPPPSSGEHRPPTVTDGRAPDRQSPVPGSGPNTAPRSTGGASNLDLFGEALAVPAVVAGGLTRWPRLERSMAPVVRPGRATPRPSRPPRPRGARPTRARTILDGRMQHVALRGSAATAHGRRKAASSSVAAVPTAAATRAGCFSAFR